MGQPLRGTDPALCRMHLGRKATVVKAEVVAKERAESLFASQQAEARRHGIADLVDPVGALHELADEAWRWKQVCQSLVSELKTVRYQAGAGEQLRGEITLYERSMDRAAAVLVSLMKVADTERLTALRQQQAERASIAISAAVSELGDLYGFDAQADAVKTVVMAHLRAVTAGE